MDSNLEEFDVYVITHVMPNIKNMETDECIDNEGLFGTSLWNKLTWLEREYLFARTMLKLIKYDDIGLELAEYDEDGNVIYRKT